jgi:hypothetical protein
LLTLHHRRGVRTVVLVVQVERPINGLCELGRNTLGMTSDDVAYTRSVIAGSVWPSRSATT